MDAKKSETRFSSLQISWLIAFVESVDYKGTAAAATLGVSPSAVSKQIDKLEIWYGGGTLRPLRLRNMYPLVLTDDGRDFLPHARQVLEILRAAKEQAREIQPTPLPQYGPPKSPKFLKVPGKGSKTS